MRSESVDFSYIPISGLTAAARLAREVRLRRAQEGPGRLMVGQSEPTGSRERIKSDRPCEACQKPLLKGSSFRLWRRPGSSKARPRHVVCPVDPSLTAR